MNEIVNTFLLEGDKFMPEMHFRQHRFTTVVEELFTENKERIQITENTRIHEYKKLRNSKHTYQNKFDKACFQHYMA